jgi:hypothetical protein
MAQRFKYDKGEFNVSSNISVLLVYESSYGRPVAVARSDSRNLLVRVAAAAIDEAQARAELLRQADQTLGEIEREEAIRLEKVLGMLIPELGQLSDPNDLRH